MRVPSACVIMISVNSNVPSQNCASSKTLVLTFWNKNTDEETSEYVLAASPFLSTNRSHVTDQKASWSFNLIISKIGIWVQLAEVRCKSRIEKLVCTQLQGLSRRLPVTSAHQKKILIQTQAFCLDAYCCDHRVRLHVRVSTSTSHVQMSVRVCICWDADYSDRSVALEHMLHITSSSKTSLHHQEIRTWKSFANQTTLDKTSTNGLAYFESSVMRRNCLDAGESVVHKCTTPF